MPSQTCVRKAPLARHRSASAPLIGPRGRVATPIADREGQVLRIYPRPAAPTHIVQVRKNRVLDRTRPSVARALPAPPMGKNTLIRMVRTTMSTTKRLHPTQPPGGAPHPPLTNHPSHPSRPATHHPLPNAQSRAECLHVVRAAAIVPTLPHPSQLHADQSREEPPGPWRWVLPLPSTA